MDIIKRLHDHDMRTCNYGNPGSIYSQAANEIGALYAVIHMAWVETREGTTIMPSDVQAAFRRVIDAYSNKKT